MIPLFKVGMAPNVGDKVLETLYSGYIGQGPKVEEFEARLCTEMGGARIFTVNSGTSGLHLALHLLKKPSSEDGFHGVWPGLEMGDEVLTTPLTCTATNWPILGNGLKIQWVDVNLVDANLCLDDLKSKLSPKTKVVMIVHWGGYAVDLDRLSDILDAAAPRLGFRPMVVEDCAHSWKSTYKDKILGNHGNLSVFSFQAIKHLTTGDGGMVVVPNDELLRRGKLLRWYGIDRDDPRGDFRCENDVVEWGFKFHMNDINAAIGMANLEFANQCVSKHRENAEFYNDALSNVPGLKLLDYEEDRRSAYWIYTIRIENRDAFMRKLNDANIMVSRVHERNDKHTTVTHFIADLPKLDRLIGEIVCIPVGWWLTDNDRNHIVDTIKSGW